MRPAQRHFLDVFLMPHAAPVVAQYINEVNGLMARLRHPYLLTMFLVAAATILGKTLFSRVGPTNQVMLYLLAVVLSGLWCGRNATVFASILGVLAFDVFFVPPLYLLTVADAEYLITFAAFLVVALVVGTLTGRLKEHAADQQAREQETAALYAFSRRMAGVRDLTEAARAVLEHLRETFGQRVALEILGEGVWGAARSDALRIPLRTQRGTVGNLLVSDLETLDKAQRRLLEGLGAQIAVAVEREQLARAAQRAEVLAKAEKVHDALLNSISHSLRTPMASIIGSLSTLLETGEGQLDPETRCDLMETAREEAERLNGLVGNLLDMTRLESGHLKLLVDWYDIADVIGASLRQAEHILRDRQIQMEVPGDLPLIPLDQVLIIQVLMNLLSNAITYSPPDTPVDIGVRQMPGALEIRVSDRGEGIPAAERERVFEKFQRFDRPDSPAGTGLGLAICKGIVEAHRGRIWAEERPGGGAVIAFTLPAGEGSGTVG